MNGCLIPDTPIMVDLWRRVNNPSSKHYFLSHMHSDHTQGLSASWRWPIYCSPLSAKLLIDKFQIQQCLVRPLELNQSHIIQLDHAGRESMTVTLFDANHCPGSVMFLFEGYFGRILYTGDYRYDSSTFPESFLGPGRPVDKLYLDNTFNNPRCKFPSRAECKQKILEILANYPDHEVVLGVYTLGKEDLLVDVALALNTRVVVSPARLITLQVLEMLDVFTTDKDGGRVRLVPRRAISKKNMAKWNEEAPTIAIIPTGLFSLLDGQPFINQADVFIVPYSDHSSYRELRQFVSRVCPRAIIPIVKDSSFMNSNRSVADMHNFDDLLDRSPSAPFVIPPSVLKFMATDHSGSTHHSESYGDLKTLIELRKSKSFTRRNNHMAMGVVFQDDDDLEETTPVQPLEQSKCKADPQQQPLSESECTRIHEQQTHYPQQKVVNSPGETISKDHILPHLCEEKVEAMPTKVLRFVENTTSQIREINMSHSEAQKDRLKMLQTEPSCRFSSVNASSHVSQGATAKKKGFLPKKCKRKFDERETSGHSKCLDAESVLIRSMSNKKPRALPDSCAGNPTLDVNVQSSGDSRRQTSAKSSSSKKIQDYFDRLTVSAPTNEPTVSPNVQSEHNVCDMTIQVASIQATTLPLDNETADRVVSSSAAARQRDHAVDDFYGLTSTQSPFPRKMADIDEQQSQTDKLCTGGRNQNIATGISSDGQCQTKLYMGHVRVKPWKPKFASQKGDGLKEAFRNVFTNK